MFAQTPNGEMQTRSKLVLLLVLAVLVSAFAPKNAFTFVGCSAFGSVLPKVPPSRPTI
jgi:hypothetical protein